MTKKTASVKTLVLPVAGLGKRLRPLTLRTPKNLVKVAGRELIDYVLEDAAKSGIERVVVVASPRHAARFRVYLAKAKKQYGFSGVSVVTQAAPLGDGHAVLQAGARLGRGPVAVRFCDDIIVSKDLVIGSLVRLFDEYRSPVLLFQKVSWENVSRYGIAGVDKTMRRLSRFPKGHVHRVDELIEKPERDAAPSNLGVVGGYVLTPRLIRNLRKMFRMLKSRHADALRIIDGFQRELVEHRHVYGWEFSGKRLDCGNLEGYYGAEEYLRRKKGR